MATFLLFFLGHFLNELMYLSSCFCKQRSMNVRVSIQGYPVVKASLRLQAAYRVAIKGVEIVFLTQFIYILLNR